MLPLRNIEETDERTNGFDHRPRARDRWYWTSYERIWMMSGSVRLSACFYKLHGKRVVEWCQKSGIQVQYLPLLLAREKKRIYPERNHHQKGRRSPMANIEYRLEYGYLARMKSWIFQGRYFSQIGSQSPAVVTAYVPRSSGLTMISI